LIWSISFRMAVDTRLLSYWTQRQASRPRDGGGPGTPAPTVSDGYAALIARIEKQATPLHLVARREQ
jgi:hypothetical protein